MTRQGSLLGRAAAALAVAVFVTLGAATPAGAQPADSDSEACWLDADTGAFECFADRDAWLAALEERGYELITLDGEADAGQGGESLDGGSGLLTIYTLATFFQDINYGGSALNITTGNSFMCVSTTYNGNMPAGWNDVVSSFQSFGGCRTRLAADINQGGTLYGPATNASTLGTFNDTASSYRILD